MTTPLTCAYRGPRYPRQPRSSVSSSRQIPHSACWLTLSKNPLQATMRTALPSGSLGPRLAGLRREDRLDTAQSFSLSASLTDSQHHPEPPPLPPTPTPPPRLGLRKGGPPPAQRSGRKAGPRRRRRRGSRWQGPAPHTHRPSLRRSRANRAAAAAGAQPRRAAHASAPARQRAA